MFDQDQPATVFMPSNVTPPVVGSPGSPPPPPPPSQKKSSKKTLLISLVALFILGGGILTGLTLVSQQQDLRSRADTTSFPLCPTNALGCNITTFPGAIQCEMLGAAVNPLWCCKAGDQLHSTLGCITPNSGTPPAICPQGTTTSGSFCAPGTSAHDCGPVPLWQTTHDSSCPSTVRCCPVGGGGGGSDPLPGPGAPPPGWQVCGSCSCASIGLGDRGNECQINNNSQCVWNPSLCGAGGGGAPPPPKKVCGETCSVNTDCANAATPGVSVICRNGFCENADCPQGQTVFGANCTCGSNSRLCGQTCGATVGLCAEGSCTYTGGPSCAVGAPTHCAGTLNGYQRLFCVDRDQFNNYLKGPSGKTSAFSEAEIRASCSTGANCPVGGTTGRKSSCGGICQVDSDCRAPSGGGTAACRGGICENTACPAGKTLAGSACLCAGSTIETQQCGQPCGSFGLCAPGQGICRYINTGGNNCPWGWTQTYCVSTLNGFTTPQCAFGDTGGSYLVAPGNKTSGITFSEMRQSCQACGDGIVQPGEDCDDGAANGTAGSVCDSTCKATNCSLATPAPSPTPQPTPTPAPLTAVCQLIKIFDENWNALTLNELATFTAGRKVRFTVGGTTNQGSFDQARFTINGTQRTAVTSKRPNTQEFYDEFTIPTGTTTFTVSAQLHHSTLGWF